ncbi:hypothetical protein [Enterobacter hormaechei]|uniref:hypothetical protein n=1 Tax=Enterobacter hormaechei TaxID=158836 RepID=UPI000F875498|nr:hypothetical protein [Enterobacter hormaechei]RTP02473.1 hypothetical protein EKN57_11290 [Enterobacter hormaechei]
MDNSNEIAIQLQNLRDTLRNTPVFPADSGTCQVIRNLGLVVADLLQEKFPHSGFEVQITEL